MLLRRHGGTLHCFNDGPKARQYRAARAYKPKRHKARPGMTFLPGCKRVTRQVRRPAHLWGRL